MGLWGIGHRTLTVAAAAAAAVGLIAAAPSAAGQAPATSLSMRSTTVSRLVGDSTMCEVTYYLTVEGRGRERIELQADYYVPDSETVDHTETSFVQVTPGEETAVLSWSVTAASTGGYHATVTASVVGKNGLDVAPATVDGECGRVVEIP